MIDAATNREIVLQLVNTFDPTIRCAEPNCGISLSFKNEWLRNELGLESLLPDSRDREASLNWWRERQKLPWFCSQHNGPQ